MYLLRMRRRYSHVETHGQTLSSLERYLVFKSFFSAEYKFDKVRM